MAVGVAALAAHPAVVRQPGVVEEPLAAPGQRRLRPGPREIVAEAAAGADLDDRDRVVAACRRRRPTPRPGRAPRPSGRPPTAIRRKGWPRARGRWPPRRRPRRATIRPPVARRRRLPSGSPAALPTSPRSMRRLPRRRSASGLGGRQGVDPEDAEVIVHQRAPVDVVEAGLARRLSVWCATTSVRPSGPVASPRMLCAGRDRTDSSVPSRRVDHGELAAEGVGDDERRPVPDQGQLSRAERQVERPGDLQRPGRPSPSPAPARSDERQPARPERGDDAGASRRARRRRGPGRGRPRPGRRPRSIAPAAPGGAAASASWSTASRCVPSGSGARSARPRPTSYSATTCAAATSMTEMLPLPRLATSRSFPPSAKASATGRRARDASALIPETRPSPRRRAPAARTPRLSRTRPPPSPSPPVAEVPRCRRS